MSDEEVMTETTLDNDDGKKPAKAKKERKRAPGAFAAFESKYHVVGNVLMLVICICLIAMCAFSNATFAIFTLPDGTQAEVSQNMIQMGSAFTAFSMSESDLMEYKAEVENTIATEVDPKLSNNPASSDPERVKEIYEDALAEHSEFNYAKYILVNALLDLRFSDNVVGDVQEETTIVDTIQKYVAFGLTVLGIGAVLPMGLAVLSLAILLLKCIFILIFCRNGKSLHVAFPLVCTFTILALLMLQLGAVGEPGAFLYALFGAAFAGMLIVGIVRYAAYPNKFVGKGLVRYMLMDAAFISAFCLSLTNPLSVTVGSDTTSSVSMSIGQLVSSGIFTSGIPAEFDLQSWLIPLGVEVVMLFATLIMGCIMASKINVVGDRWRKRQWKARNELTTISAILLTGCMAAFAWVYSYVCNTYLDLGFSMHVNTAMFVAPGILAVLLILLLIIRPTKKVKKASTEDVDD